MSARTSWRPPRACGWSTSIHRDRGRFVWPPSFTLARAYLDQLDRGAALSIARVAELRRELDAAEEASGGARWDALARLADELQREVDAARDPRRMRLLVSTLRELAAETR